MDLRWIFVPVILLLLLGTSGCDGVGDRNSALGPNVILISIDTLRADRMSLYGYDRETTPHLEKFAKEGVVFDQFINNGGGTLPSHMSMMTSLHPTTHGISPESGYRLEPERVTLAEALENAGFVTGAFVDAGWVSGKFGFDQGFETYDDDGGHLERIMPKVNWWLNQHVREQFFLFFHTYDVHSQHERLPYDCPGGFSSRYTGEMDVDFNGCREGKCATELLKWINDQIREGSVETYDVLSREEIEFVSALYDGCINYVDSEIGRFFDRLRVLDVFDSSLIVVSSDHGEEFFEHGLLLHDQEGYEEQAHLPLIVKFPGGKFGGTRVPHLAAMVDVMPTILMAVGASVPDDAQGFDLLRSLALDAPLRGDVHQYQSLRTDRFTVFSNPPRLFDRASDAGEKDNIFEREPYLGLVLTRRLNELITEDESLRGKFLEENGSAAEFVLSPKEVEKLKALGYLQ